MKIIVEGYGDMTVEVAAELALLRQEENARLLRQAASRQRRIAAASREAGNLACGHLVAQIDAPIYDYWQRREGRGFWSDKSNLKYMLKRHPELAVRSRSRRASIVNPGLPAPAAAAPADQILDAHGRAAA